MTQNRSRLTHTLPWRNNVHPNADGHSNKETSATEHLTQVYPQLLAAHTYHFTGAKASNRDVALTTKTLERN